MGTKCPDGGTCHHKCLSPCARRDELGCLPLSISGLDDNWNKTFDSYWGDMSECAREHYSKSDAIVFFAKGEESARFNLSVEIKSLQAKLSQAEAEKAELVKRIKELNRYSFLSGGPNGGVRRYMDKSGSWVEYHEVIKLLGDDA